MYIAQEILLLQSSYLTESRISEERIHEVAEDWASVQECRTVFGAAFKARDAAAREKRWLVRLANASPKDADIKMPVTSLHQLVQLLATSMRARARSSAAWEMAAKSSPT